LNEPGRRCDFSSRVMDIYVAGSCGFEGVARMEYATSPVLKRYQPLQPSLLLSLNLRQSEHALQPLCLVYMKHECYPPIPYEQDHALAQASCAGGGPRSISKGKFLFLPQDLSRLNMPYLAHSQSPKGYLDEGEAKSSYRMHRFSRSVVVVECFGCFVRSKRGRS
jgi:hypothetical protein